MGYARGVPESLIKSPFQTVQHCFSVCVARSDTRGWQRKWPRCSALSQQPGTAKKPRQQGQSEGQPSKRPRQTRRGQRGNGQRTQADNLNNIVSILAALSLQQEDALNRVRLDSSHAFHLEQAGPGAILKALYEAGRSWHEKKGQGVPLPALRTVVFALLVLETKARLALFAQDSNAVKAAVDKQLMNPNKQFVFQRWNPKEQKLEQDPDRNALGVEQAQQLLQELGTYCKDHIITKFNSVRKMRSQEAHTAQELLSQLANCAVWSLVAAQMRPPSLKRHGLAAVLQKALEAE